MVNPDRWLQRCAEDYCGRGDDEDRWEEENEIILEELREFGVDPKKCDLHDKVFPLQKELMQALASQDDDKVLSIMYSIFDVEVTEMTDRAVENY
jgi:hypothetical protein